jgi:hypothetical protein
MTKTQERISNAKEVFRIIDQDLGKIVECTEVDRLATIQKLRAINEELGDMVLTLVKKNEALKIKCYEQSN